MGIDDIFGATGQASGAQECARAVVIFLYGLVVVRVVGRRVFAQWSALDIVVAIITGSTLSRALTGNANLFGTLAAVTVLMALHWMLARAAATWPPLSHLVEGAPVRLGESGLLDDELARRHGVSAGMLAQALRAAGIERPEQARLVVLEASGRISVLKEGA
jgi:uncharacterized membrane protein YcaP (DUF421 family)